MKKLDKLIIKAFIGPFLATFFITVFVLVMQFLWLWIDDFVGKGVDVLTILKFVWYLGASLIPMALPLAVLLSSLMTFGNLGESFELVAIKSSGISLLRFMRPLFIVVAGISFAAFLFANYVIPVVNLKQRTMLGDIVLSKPAFDIKEGVFYDKIPGFAIKIGKKINDSIINDVIVFENNNNNLQDNIVIAKSGVMKPSPKSTGMLDFYLRDGQRYQERGSPADSNTEYIRMGFREYKKQFDISSFGLKMSQDSTEGSNEKVLNMRQLDKAIDSIGKNNRIQEQSFNNTILGSFTLLRFKDSVIKADVPDSVIKDHAKNIKELIPDSTSQIVREQALSVFGNMKSSIDFTSDGIENRAKDLRRYKIEWHKKLALAAACLVLFMIGAPLGSIIRKGGLGTPLIFAIVFFMLFYFMSARGEKMSKEGVISAFNGVWLATFILVPIGAFITYKALRDSNLFNKEFYVRLRRNVMAAITKIRSRMANRRATA